MSSEKWGGDKRSKQQQSARRAINGRGGKGSWDRTSDNNKYRLGMELIRIAEEFGNDSPEYNNALNAWRNA